MRDTIGIFDVVDWLWSFRWLALGLALLAAIGTAYFVLVEKRSPDQAQSGFEVVVDIHGQGTPLRGIAETAEIFESALRSDSLSLVSQSGTVPVIFWTDKKSIAESAEVEGDRIVQLLMAELETRISVLTPLVQRDQATEIATNEYLKTLSFLDGVESGLIEPFRVGMRQASPFEPRAGYILLALPWILAGLVFLLIAGAATSFRAWRRHRERTRHTIGSDGGR